jgi:protein TonB
MFKFNTILALLFVCNFVYAQNKEEVKEIEIKAIEIKPGEDYSIEKIVVEEPSEDEIIPFVIVEQIPLFQTCKNTEKKDQINCFTDEMKKHVEKNLKYPKEAKKQKIEGKVIIVFEIDKNGKVTNVMTRSNFDEEYKTSFEEEAKRIINKLPLFIPGRQHDKPVNIRYYLPINFKI